MGHRKRSQPRRGSLAYLPRGRAKSFEARIRSWPTINSDEPKILAHAGFKAGCVQLVTIDDREKTPNAGKQLVSLGTVIVTPPLFVVGIRGYSKDNYGLQAAFDIYAKHFGNIQEIYAIVGITPTTNLDQKKPYIFEAAVKGGDIKKQFEFVKRFLGKEMKIDQVFETGVSVDAAAITKGKGWEGPITRWGVKKKQHKSRKSVREVGSLGPISPASIMYTVPRAGQRGFHQRTEYNKRIMIMSNTEKNEVKINPEGGFKHFGLVNGDFVIVKGSVPGTYRRLIKLRTQIRNVPSKILKPHILEVVL